jgi:hypothetical protein
MLAGSRGAITLLAGRRNRPENGAVVAQARVSTIPECVDPSGRRKTRPGALFAARGRWIPVEKAPDLADLGAFCWSPNAREGRRAAEIGTFHGRSAHAREGGLGG